MTRICVPTAGRGGLADSVGEHFGRVPTYTIYDTETRQVNVVDNTSEHAGGTGLPADILSKLGIDVLLCRGAGRKALAILGENGIMVCFGVDGTAGEAIDAWKAGSLVTASEADACQQHAFHDHEKH
ncbi:NifB/NifX family molybdenum-iron cluster-binding protein [Candidatus Bipolaricaulota bacterium]